MRSGHLLTIVGVVCCIAFSDKRLPLLAASAELDKLELWVGHWRTEGTGGTSLSVDDECAWLPNHRFVVCDQTINGKTNQLLILTYDMADNTYRVSSLGTDRDPVVGRATLNGKIWTTRGEFDSNGKKTLIKNIVDFSHNDYRVDSEMVSDDGGAHWTENSHARLTKVPDE